MSNNNQGNQGNQGGKGYNKYIGARYVPLIMGEYDPTINYEPLSVVLYEGASYTSKTFVPRGILPTAKKFWALTGNYNAQVEQYKQEVEKVKTDIDRVVGRLDSMLIPIEVFGSFGNAVDNDNFLVACDFAVAVGGTLLVRNRNINLKDINVPNLANMIFENSVINLEGQCKFERTDSNFTLEGVNIVSRDRQEDRLFNVTRVTGVRVKDFNFKFEGSVGSRCSQVFSVVESRNVEFINCTVVGANVGIGIRDSNKNAVSRDILIENSMFKDCQTGIYVSAFRTDYTPTNFIENVQIINASLVNTEAQSNAFDTLQGADLIMCERVRNLRASNLYCVFPVERIAYLNVVEDVVVTNVVGYNCEGIKVSGLPDTLSKNFIIDNVNIVNVRKGNYLFRGYFAENGVLSNMTIDNSQMATKPDNIISVSCYLKNVRFEGLNCNGSSRAFLQYRMEDFSGSSGLYAFDNHTPLLGNISLVNSTIRNVCLVNANTDLFELRYNFDAQNPAFNADPNILNNKQIVTDLIVDNTIFDVRNAYQGRLATFKCLKNLVLKCTLKQYRALYAYRFVSYEDNISKNAQKTLNVVVDAVGFPTTLPANHEDIMSGATPVSCVTINYGNNAVYNISYDNLDKVIGNLDLKRNVVKTFASDESFIYLSWSYNANENYMVDYEDITGKFKAIISGDGTINVTEGSAYVSTEDVDGKLCLFSSGGFIRLLNKTSENLRATTKFSRFHI